jgi:hypothetical protein
MAFANASFAVSQVSVSGLLLQKPRTENGIGLHFHAAGNDPTAKQMGVPRKETIIVEHAESKALGLEFAHSLAM